MTLHLKNKELLKEYKNIIGDIIVYVKDIDNWNLIKLYRISEPYLEYPHPVHGLKEPSFYVVLIRIMCKYISIILSVGITLKYRNYNG